MSPLHVEAEPRSASIVRAPRGQVAVGSERLRQNGVEDFSDLERADILHEARSLIDGHGGLHLAAGGAPDHETGRPRRPARSRAGEAVQPAALARSASFVGAAPIESAIDPMTAPIELAVDPCAAAVQPTIDAVSSAVQLAIDAITLPVETPRHTILAGGGCPIRGPIQFPIDAVSSAIEMPIDPVPATIETVLDAVALAVQPILDAVAGVRESGGRQQQEAGGQSGREGDSIHCGISGAIEVRAVQPRGMRRVPPRSAEKTLSPRGPGRLDRIYRCIRATFRQSPG